MKQLKIDDNYKIEFDENNCTLVRLEQKTREKVDKNRKKTGETEEIIDETRWYFPNVTSTLQKYLQETQKDATTVEDCIRLTNESMEIIKKLKF